MKMILIVLLAMLALASVTRAEIVVIVNPGAHIDSLSQDDVQRIFLGKTKKFPTGEQAVPINQDKDRAIRDKFYEMVCNKDPGQYRSYWSQLIFTGKGAPPKDAGDDAAVKELIAKNPNLITYIDEAKADNSVKIVYRVK